MRTLAWRRRQSGKPSAPLKAATWTAGAIAGGAGLVWAGHAAWEAHEHWGTPNCSWPAQVQGTLTAAQDGLLRCYLRALASRDTAGLMAVAADIPSVRITRTDLVHSADAGAGLAMAAFTPNPVDPTSAFVTITFADGAREDLGMTNMIAMGGPSGWRMDIGTPIDTGSSQPPPAEPSLAPSSLQRNRPLAGRTAREPRSEDEEQIRRLRIPQGCFVPS
jgi:hypothetical protein